MSRPAYASQMSETVHRVLPRFRTLNFIDTTTSLAGFKIRTHLEVFPPLLEGMVQRNHQASGTSAPGKYGAWAAPTASCSWRLLRLSFTSSVAWSPWQMPSSPSTKTLASRTSKRGATATNSSASTNSCELRLRASRPLRSSSLSKESNWGRPADFRGPLRQSFKRSRVKCGTCSKGPAPEAPQSLGSNACTTHRWSSSAASSGSPSPSLVAMSAMAKQTSLQRPSSSSRSPAKASPRSSLLRCVCARKSNSAF
mmetsp:Transcript_14045/g.38630  ORF Transcript_14045/g.38630 Transcript_14045/m.38630 type:complete len:254 (+) Transcript_14045:186-947(+)